MIYLDNAATSKIHPYALKKMNETWGNWANPSALHKLGKQNYYLLESSRNNIKKILNIQKNAELYFTSSATESNNLILNSTNLPILASPFEHPSILNFPNINIIDFEKIEQILQKKQYLVSLSLVNNETGMIVATKKLRNLVKKYNSQLHIDASQAKNINFEELNCDYLTISSHKLGGPIGIACLISKPLLKPFLYGGGQEFNIRSSTQALPLIIGFESAIKVLNTQQHYENLYNVLKAELNPKYFFETYVNEEFTKHIICLLTYDKPATEVFAYMDLNNIAISYGSACSSGTLDKLKILNIYKNIPSKNAIRISFGFDTTISEVQTFIKLFKKII